jgi:hypothetical protein
LRAFDGGLDHFEVTDLGFQSCFENFQFGFGNRLGKLALEIPNSGLQPLDLR